MPVHRKWLKDIKEFSKNDSSLQTESFALVQDSEKFQVLSWAL